MESSTFDAIVQQFASVATRRTAMRGLMAGALAAVAGGASLTPASAKPKDRCKKPGSPCTNSKQCCPKETKLKCAVASNAGNSDETCCGGNGATCGGQNSNGDDKAPFCCAGFDCVGRMCRRAE